MIRCASAVALAGILCALACSREPIPASQLMVVITTDMDPPKDFERVELLVTSSAQTVHEREYTIGPGGEKLPLTIAVSGTPGTRVSIVVSAQMPRLGVQHTSRIATAIPNRRAALVRLPLNWLCIHRGCSRCVAGKCEPEEVDVNELPDYAPERVFGGGPDPTAGTCFTMRRCLAAAGGGRVVTAEPSHDGIGCMGGDGRLRSRHLEPAGRPS